MRPGEVYSRIPDTNRLRRFRYLNLQKKNKYDTPNNFPPNCNILTSIPGIRACGSKCRNREDLAPNPSTDGDKKNPWNGQAVEADHKDEDREKYPGESHEKPRLCWDPQRKEVHLPFIARLHRRIASYVAAVHHPHLRPWIRISISRPRTFVLGRRVSIPRSIMQPRPTARLAILLPAHLPLSSLRNKVKRYQSRSRNGISKRHSTQERQCRERNTW